MCEQESYFADLCNVLMDIEDKGALSRDQAAIIYHTLQSIGERLEKLESRLKTENLLEELLEM